MWNFHRRQAIRFNSPFRSTICDEENGSIIGYEFSHHDIYVPFRVAKEIMNRYRYGKEHGCPETDLDFNFPDTRPENWRSRRRLLLNAKIVNGELILKVDQSSLIPYKYTDSLRSWVWLDVPKHGISETECFPDILEKGRDFAFVRSWLNVGSCKAPSDVKWRLAVCCSATSLSDFCSIDPEDSLYAHCFYDRSPRQLKEQLSKLLWGNNWADPFGT
ncbi:hypothetical protein AJ79_08337 [Helicocarpus griseus UAMH5409]|uniref:Uncharacterized protein n=1 Tax=Helicocarpus griseus UAMH5409 TaxID=1447875 RepID=A0A2B7WTD4_9EURO|nr:hypothetical protein AJ79_08337 [Helicocarpus griseus UAMH5409]